VTLSQGRISTLRKLSIPPKLFNLIVEIGLQ
jgi:hypothetical protein